MQKRAVPSLNGQRQNEHRRNPTGKNPPDDLNVIIEVPMAGADQYEIDKASVPCSSTAYPIRHALTRQLCFASCPTTLCGDGDPLDVIVMNSRPLVPGAVVRCRPIAFSS